MIFLRAGSPSAGTPSSVKNKDTPMYRLFWLFPVLAHVLMAAHLMFNGFGLVAACVPLVLMLLLFVPKAFMRAVQTVLFLGYAAEWLRTGWLMAERRLAYGMSIHPAVEIMVAVALFTTLAALVLNKTRLRSFWH